ncbi:MAG: hypothetical protein M3Q23_10545 [Actinomycetota bacterium]|nr:hypothetical protein [Actinomycetota bacterium]
MSLAYPSAPAGRLVRLIDAALIAWTVVWVVVGVMVARDVRGLTQLSDTVVAGGQVLRATGSELGALSSIPFVGDQIGSVGHQVNDAADQAIASGRDSAGRVRSLSVLLGFAIALIPTVPLIALYTPLRVARVREVRAVRRAMAEARGDPVFEQFLARRAAERLPYYRLRQISQDPWYDLATGRYERLAAAELERLGLSRASRRMRARSRAWPEGASG